MANQLATDKSFAINNLRSAGYSERRIAQTLGVSRVALRYTRCVHHPAEKKTMQKMLIKHGNSLALVIDKPILEMLLIDANTPRQLTTNGDQILVTPCRDKARQKKLGEGSKGTEVVFERRMIAGRFRRG